jgi:hypothetical protein
VPRRLSGEGEGVRKGHVDLYSAFDLLFQGTQRLCWLRTCPRTIFEDPAGDLPQVDYFACFDGDEVERDVWNFDEAVEADAGGSHGCEVGCVRVREVTRFLFLERWKAVM